MKTTETINIYLKKFKNNEKKTYFQNKLKKIWK